MISWDTEAEALLGFTEGEMLGRSLSDTIVPPRYRLQHNRGLAEFRRTGEAPAVGHRLSVTALRKDGREIPVYLTLSKQSGDPTQFGGGVEARMDLSYAEVLGAAQPEQSQRSPTAAEWRSRDGAESTPFSRAEFDNLRERVSTLERLRAEEATAYGTATLGPLEKAVIPAFIRWYIDLQRRVGTSTKTGIELIHELIATRAERMHLNRATVITLGAVTPFLVALLTAALTIFAARTTPTIPSPPPPIPLTTPAPIPDHQPPSVPAPTGRP